MIDENLLMVVFGVSRRCRRRSSASGSRRPRPAPAAPSRLRLPRRPPLRLPPPRLRRLRPWCRSDLETFDLVFLAAAGFGLLLGDQRLPVGDRDLVIVGMDFREGEEALAVAAIFDKGGLQRRLNARHLGEIDVALERPLGSGLEIKFLDLGTVENDHPGLFRVAGVDKHALVMEISGARACIAGGTAVRRAGRRRRELLVKEGARRSVETVQGLKRSWAGQRRTGAQI